MKFKQACLDYMYIKHTKIFPDSTFMHLTCYLYFTIVYKDLMNTQSISLFLVTHTFYSKVFVSDFFSKFIIVIVI